MTFYTTMTRRISNIRLHHLLGYGVILHAMLFLYDFSHPDAFLMADRAGDRMRTIRAFWATVQGEGSVLDFLGSHGIVGDYLPQALLFGIGGKSAIVVAQVMLLLLSVYYVHRLVAVMGGSERMATLCAAVYMHLPHSLTFPHQLTSEAIFGPLFIISIGTLCGALPGLRSYLTLSVSGAALGLATLVRPITLLWAPFSGSIIVAALRNRPAIAGMAFYVAVALAPVAAWIFTVYLATGTASLGPSTHDMSHNLYQRVVRMVSAMPPDEMRSASAQYLPHGNDPAGTMTIGEYASFAASHPKTYITHLGKDALVFVGKSGVGRLVLDYLNLFPASRDELQDSRASWRLRWEKEGPAATLLYLYRNHGSLLLITALASALCAGIFALAFLGILNLARWAIQSSQSPQQRITIFVVITAPFYIFATSQVVNAMQSRHRAPAEFAVLILAAFGLRAIRSWLIKRTAADSSMEPTTRSVPQAGPPREPLI